MSVINKQCSINGERFRMLWKVVATNNLQLIKSTNRRTTN